MMHTLHSYKCKANALLWFMAEQLLIKALNQIWRKLTLILAARAGNKLPNVYVFTEDQSKELKI
jgi:hypothetical protein